LSAFPEAPLLALDTLWLQVAGTLCNLQCAHCFVSSSPTNHSFEMMSLDGVRRLVAEAESQGVKEYYFTGGEPFLHRDILEMLEAALAVGPVTVLTNGVLIRPDTAVRLRALSDASDYSLDLRVSLDGLDAAANDRVRGSGTYERILEGIRHLASAGLTPVVTVTEACEGAETAEGRARLIGLLREIGLAHPRLKVMPLLRLGAETGRTRGYETGEDLRGAKLTRAEVEVLACATGRMATARGIWVCPILVDSPDARMGATLRDTFRPFALSHSACYTCHVRGLSCRT
jgi:MoaA/NifB/PqqE/SkfB family radical SAM enzyme